MADWTIVGVDFSGAEKSNTTQVTTAVLRVDALELQPYEPLPKSLPSTHNKLKNLLMSEHCNRPTVAALDFPFSVPQAFARELVPDVSTMPELWGVVAAMDYNKFKEKRDGFVERHGEVMRRGDANLGGPFSPLHEVRPGMLKMTYHGMRLLDGLWNSAEPRFQVPPLPKDQRDGPILLETMPGVLLRSFGLPHNRYKTSYHDKKAAKKNREKILVGLEDKKTSGVELKNLDSIRDWCIRNDDCLDSLVAAIGAAMWVTNKSRFRHPLETMPPDEEIKAAQLEGWIYAPKPVQK